MVKTNLSNSNKLNSSQCLKNLKDTIVSSSTLNTDSNKKDVENHPLIIYHQNIRGLKDKIEELVISIPPRRYPYFDVVGGLVWSDDPESYAGGSVCYQQGLPCQTGQR